MNQTARQIIDEILEDYQNNKDKIVDIPQYLERVLTLAIQQTIDHEFDCADKLVEEMRDSFIKGTKLK